MHQTVRARRRPSFILGLEPAANEWCYTCFAPSNLQYFCT